MQGVGAVDAKALISFEQVSGVLLEIAVDTHHSQACPDHCGEVENRLVKLLVRVVDVDRLFSSNRGGPSDKKSLDIALDPHRPGETGWEWTVGFGVSIRRDLPRIFDRLGRIDCRQGVYDEVAACRADAGCGGELATEFTVPAEPPVE